MMVDFELNDDQIKILKEKRDLYHRDEHFQKGAQVFTADLWEKAAEYRNKSLFFMNLVI